ncbi:polyhydroxyalkanoic acid system family protein [Sphingomonas sabuli]|uniref:Polyhydroxyalkanoic acid system family protein n=1 Tax=Sphingomonas sabuli TaxID=2764186 RepID=A0A7G9L178_9SPHN|nr:polyhydroxyalkanoic acid system family protein [Sphingomonas sabuli]QNM82377.1 polyhydroxyalkanoic acid system family protein [Sphingomonas sabuli]
MAQPIDVDLPHKLGKEEAKRRIGGNIHKLHDQIPGGANVQSRWEGDTIKLAVAAMGDTINADITVQESNVHCHFELPGLLGMFAGPIAAMLKAKGGDLLLEDKRS